jgi:hypothetical protein
VEISLFSRKKFPKFSLHLDLPISTVGFFVS